MLWFKCGKINHSVDERLVVVVAFNSFEWMKSF
jgi:hypothetical protein